MNTMYNGQMCEIIEFISHREVLMVIVKKPDGLLKGVLLADVRVMTPEEETKEKKKNASKSASNDVSKK